MNNGTVEVFLNGQRFEVTPISFVQFVNELRKRGTDLSPQDIVFLDERHEDLARELHRAKFHELAIAANTREALLGEASPEFQAAISAEWRKFGGY